jgi:hypothetical protein
MAGSQRLSKLARVARRALAAELIVLAEATGDLNHG